MIRGESPRCGELFSPLKPSIKLRRENDKLKLSGRLKVVELKMN